MANQESPRQEMTFMGHTITLNEEYWTFKVTGPEFDDAKYEVAFKSLESAKTEIAKRVEETNKAKAQNINVNIIVIDEHCNRTEVDRINRTTSNIHGVQGRFVYPNNGSVRDMLARRSQLMRDLKAIESKLEPLQIRVSRGYGRIKAEDYPSVVENLQQEHQRKLTKAKELDTPPPLKVVESAPDKAS